MRLTISTTQPAGIATAAAAALAGHEVILHLAPSTDGDFSGFVGRTDLPTDGVYGSGTAAFACVTDDLATAMDAPEMVVVVGEAPLQRQVAAAAARAGRDTVFLLAPGGVCGALEFAGLLRGTAAEGAVVAETNGLMHLGAVGSDGTVTVKGVKRDLPLAFFPSRVDEGARTRVLEVFPDLATVENVLVTSLANTNTVVHGAVSILNAGMIESRGGDFPFFTQALSPGGGRLMEAVDRERVTLLRALGLPPVTTLEWFRRFYADQNMRGDNLYEMLSTFGPFQRSKSPSSLQHRYFSEDIPFGLVPIASLARRFAEPAVATEAIITLSSIVCGRDFWQTGRTVESLGLAGLSRDGLLHLVESGWAA